MHGILVWKNIRPTEFVCGIKIKYLILQSVNYASLFKKEQSYACGIHIQGITYISVSQIR